MYQAKPLSQLLNMFKKLKKDMEKDKKTIKIICEQNENTNKEIKIIKRNQKEILELKNRITKM